MKTLSTITYIASLILISNFTIAQLFSTSTTLPKVLNSGGTHWSNCSTPGTYSVSFTVSGVGTLNTTNNQLAEIRLILRSGTSKTNLLNLTCYLKAPNGTCVQIANQMGSSNFVATNTNFQYKFRSPKSCLNKAPDYSTGLITGNPATENTSGYFGIFSTTNDIESALNGINANGTWTLFFGRSNTSTSFPDVTSASLLFGEPEPTNHSADGNTCPTAVPWDGDPICLSLSGKTGNFNSPGWNGSASFTTSGNYSATCAWNNSNDNNIWISFTATSTNVCLNISGTTAALQSIVVTDPNTDGDNNPCTPAGSGTHWTTTSCPRNNIYAAVSGTTRSHNHCFNAVVGKTYYLVVDGNAGAVSDFYLTGISGLPDILPVEFQDFEATCESNNTILTWSTASENNNDYFTIEKSIDGMSWDKIGKVSGNGNSSTVNDYRFIDENKSNELVYYRLSQTDFDGSTRNLMTSVSNCQSNKINIVPNPSDGKFTINNLERNSYVKIMDFQGRIILESQVENNENMSFDLSELIKGMYLISVENQKNNIETLRFQIK